MTANMYMMGHYIISSRLHQLCRELTDAFKALIPFKDVLYSILGPDLVGPTVAV